LSSKSNAVEIVVSPKPTPPVPVGANICVGASATLSATCTTGNVVWYNSPTSTTGTTGSSFNTPTLSSLTSYYPACESGSCVSDRVKVDVRVNPKPTAPTITAAPTSGCAGTITILTASGCTGGTINWSNGKSGTTISEAIFSDFSLTATCTQSSCESPNSNVASLKVIPLAEVKSEPSPAIGTAATRYTIKLNGSINFNTPLSDGSISNHGFYFIAGNVTSLDKNTAGITTISLGLKKESSGTTFNYTFPTLQSSNVFSFVAYVIDCKGDIKYGQVLKTNP
jgi:Ig-like domain CHU_C associated